MLGEVGWRSYIAHQHNPDDLLMSWIQSGTSQICSVGSGAECEYRSGKQRKAMYLLRCRSLNQEEVCTSTY